MQYILTQEEYDALKAEGRDRKQVNTKNLQALCTNIANTMPVIRRWAKNEEPAPWGCILNEPDDTWYCDECPVRSICPYEHKRISK